MLVLTSSNKRVALTSVCDIGAGLFYRISCAFPSNSWTFLAKNGLSLLYFTCANRYFSSSSSSIYSSFFDSFFISYKRLCKISNLLFSLIVCYTSSASFREFKTFSPYKNYLVSTYVLTPLNIFNLSLNSCSFVLCTILSFFYIV